jgi:hypothetical protein
MVRAEFAELLTIAVQNCATKSRLIFLLNAAGFLGGFPGTKIESLDANKHAS